MKRILQWIGALALIGWTALGAYAWSQFKGHLNVTVQEDGGGSSNEIALLDDRLDTLTGDLDALVDSLDKNFRVLADAVQKDAESGDARQARLEESIHRVETEIEQEFSTLSSQSPPELTESKPLSTNPSPTEEPSAETPQVAKATPPKAASAEPAPEEKANQAPRRSFLAFHLPSRDLRFEGSKIFEVLEDISRVGFDAKSTLHDFTGVSNHVRGRFKIDLAHPERGIEGRVEIAAHSLETGLKARDEAMFKHLGSAEFAKIAFVPTAFEATEIDSESKRLAGNLKGRMTIRGVDKDIQMKVNGRIDESRRLVIEGEVPLRLSDFSVHVPSKLGLISMNDQVRVWIHLRARARSQAVSR